MLRMQLGTRSSISVRGRVRYPDLELLPRLEQDFIQSSATLGSGSYYSGDPDKGLRFDAVDYEGNGYGSNLDLQRIPYAGDRASDLSKMYRRAIFGQTSEAIDSAGASRQVSTSLPVEYAPQADPVQKHNDSASKKDVFKPSIESGSSSSPTEALKVRRSTLDFAKDVRLQEAQSRQVLLDEVRDIAG